MTVVWTLIILSVLALFGWLAAMTLDRLGMWWACLPHFISNSIGERFAVCSVTDFKKEKSSRPAEASPEDQRRFRLVRATLVFADVYLDTDVAQHFKRFSGTIAQGKRLPFRQHSDGLFVPYVSNSFVELAAQSTLFIPPENPEKFIERKMAENRRADFRMRFTAWAKKHNFRVWRLWLGIAWFVFLIAAGGTELFIVATSPEAKVARAKEAAEAAAIMVSHSLLAPSVDETPEAKFDAVAEDAAEPLGIGGLYAVRAKAVGDIFAPRMMFVEPSVCGASAAVIPQKGDVVHVWRRQFRAAMSTWEAKVGRDPAMFVYFVLPKCR